MRKAQQIASPLHGEPHPEEAGNEQRIRIGRDEIRQRLNDSTLRILDIRTTEEYDGKRVNQMNAGCSASGCLCWIAMMLISLLS